MCTTRRQFVGSVALGGACLTLSPLLWLEKSLAASSRAVAIPGATGERMAVAAAWSYRAYRSKSSASPDIATWVQVDLGASCPIDAVRLYPSNWHSLAGDGFPLRFRIECSDEPRFQSRQVIADWSRTDYPDPGDRIVQFPLRRASGRYVRLTTIRLRPRKRPDFLNYLPKSITDSVQRVMDESGVLGLARIGVISDGVDIAGQRPVSVDTAYGNPADAQQLTRPPRPQGEGIVTDNPQNVTAAQGWRPPQHRAQAPGAGVELRGGLFQTALENNIRYLLESSTVDDLLRPFRQRAGKLGRRSAQEPSLAIFWEDVLAGSNAGRFLMGAANTLHWIEHAGLRSRMDAVVDGIAECRQPNGYIMAYPEDTFFVSERGAYTRSWLTHGLIDAGYAGNARAFELLRGYYDWYNSRPFLAEALRGCNQGGQGMVANTRLYFTPAGKPEDIQVIQRYFQENFWLQGLVERRLEAVWHYPYDRPHAYLLTNVEAYLDLYRATGEERYLQAVLGAWDLFRENWQNIGGSISIIEGEECPPQSNLLYEKLGETCGSVFWALLNQRLHLLEPEQEKYIAEIEKAIYNVLLANQVGAEGIRYHTRLVMRKEDPQRGNTCCEGQGTRLIASLPQLIYSLAEDGVYVNLFEASAITWRCAGGTLRLQMETAFPKSLEVKLTVQSAQPLAARIRIRNPSWAAGGMSIEVNGKRAATGSPGTYTTLDRTWSDGDTISFVLPMAPRFTKYTGKDQIEGRQRYALEYGPILMAALDAPETELTLYGNATAQDPQLQPVKDKPMHFTLPTAATEFVPYFEISTESFSCFPLVDIKGGLPF